MASIIEKAKKLLPIKTLKKSSESNQIDSKSNDIEKENKENVNTKDKENKDKENAKDKENVNTKDKENARDKENLFNFKTLLKILKLFRLKDIINILKLSYIYESNQPIKNITIKHNLNSTNLLIQVWQQENINGIKIWFNDTAKIKIIDENNINIELLEPKIIKVLIEKSRYEFIYKIIKEKDVNVNLFEQFRNKLLSFK